MKLYLMRHGQAARQENDPTQGLTESGRSDIENLAKRLREHGVAFSQVFHSPKTRARQTAEIMAATLSPHASMYEHEHLKPNDHPMVILLESAHWDEDTLITSHLPFIPALLSILPGNIGAVEAIPFEPGTIVCVSRGNDQQWQFEWLASP